MQWEVVECEFGETENVSFDRPEFSHSRLIDTESFIELASTRTLYVIATENSTPVHLSWVYKEMSFWLNLVDSPICAISTTGWPEFPPPRSPEGKLLNHDFLRCDDKSVREAILERPGSSIWDLSILSCEIGGDEKVRYEKYMSFCMLFMQEWISMVPVLIGNKEWISDCKSKILAHARDRGHYLLNR